MKPTRWSVAAGLILVSVVLVVAVRSGAAGPPLAPPSGGVPTLEQQILQAVTDIQNSVNSLQATANTLQTTVNSQARKSYYLTKGSFAGDQILSPPAATPACALGYHFASLWEIFNMSNLQYNTTLGFTYPDSGSGPPANQLGWIRTGFVVSAGGDAGSANCTVWTSEDSSQHGTIVGLSSVWTFRVFSNAEPDSAEYNPVLPWIASDSNCLAPQPAWCVQD
jgi:hypothetical protein